MRLNSHFRQLAQSGRWLHRDGAAILAALLLAVATPGWAVDSDADSVDDTTDNCTATANADQRDTDGDGYGNVCDGDFDNDNTVGNADLALFKRYYGAANNPNGDFNGDGRVNLLDLSAFKRLFGKAPGPSASSGGPSNSISDSAAARFLAQATFGPTLRDIAAVKSSGGYDKWLDEQFAKGPSLLLPTAQSMYDAHRAACLAEKPAGQCPDDRATIQDTYDDQFRFVWWRNAIDGQDQLRQRVAFALSEILVVGDYPEPIAGSKFGLSDYYDTLARGAFGNYRDLLEKVTLHPIMGLYLSMARNEKANPDRNIRPDENYARELMQLFTIGVDQLDTNGRPVLDAAGQTIPTYDQATVEEFARVFTGWNFAGIGWFEWFGRADRTKPMVAVESRHDTGEKTLLGGVKLPAGRTAGQDLTAALDNVFNHPNVGPFVSRQLIQRLVTSNPTPAYVGRVAAVFNNNGVGVRGDLKAVIKAILLDSEARAVSPSANYGKLREPLLRVSHLFRAFGASKISGKEWGVAPSIAVYRSPGVWSGLRYLEEDIGQNILRSPSVFNFFQPSYSPAGPVRNARLVAPEFQIATENTVVGMINSLNFHVLYAAPAGEWSFLNLAKESALAANPDQLLDHLNAVLMGGSLSNPVRAIVRKHLVESPFPAGAEGNLQRAKDAIVLLLASPDHLIQK